jgi:hypothetical protein
VSVWARPWRSATWVSLPAASKVDTTPVFSRSFQPPPVTASRVANRPWGGLKVPSGFLPKRTCWPLARVTTTLPEPSLSGTTLTSNGEDQPAPKAALVRGSRLL